MNHLSISRLLATLVAAGALIGASCAMSSTAPDAIGAVPATSQVSPLSGPVGTIVTIAGSGFAPTGNVVKFGMGYIRNLDSADGTTIRFAVPDALDLCSPGNTGPCPGANPRTRAGEYAVSVITQSQASNSITFTVTE